MKHTTKTGRLLSLLLCLSMVLGLFSGLTFSASAEDLLPPSPDLFNVDCEDCTYDGYAHYATVTCLDSGAGYDVYYLNEDGDITDAPTEIGTYTVYIVFYGSDQYAPMNPMFGDWTLHILPHIHSDSYEEFNTLLDSGFTGGELAYGSYLLTEDITLDNPILVEPGVSVSICLNGHVISTRNVGCYVFDNHGSLTISDCNSTCQTHYFRVDEQGLWNLESSPTSGEISEAKYAVNLTGIPEAGTLVAVYGGCITGDDIGIHVYTEDGADTAALLMNGGTLVGNDAGGIFNDGSEVEVTGEAMILGNTCPEGGAGISSWNSGDTPASCTVGGDARISFNTADNDYDGSGGAIFATNTSLTVMDQAQISYNFADDSGGIYLTGESTLNLWGGSVCHNTSYATAGIDARGSWVIVQGMVFVTDNVNSEGAETNLLIDSDHRIAIGETGLSTDSRIAVTLEGGESGLIVEKGSGDDAACFISDVDAYMPAQTDYEVELVSRVTGVEDRTVQVTSDPDTEVTYQWYLHELATRDLLTVELPYSFGVISQDGTVTSDYDDTEGWIISLGLPDETESVTFTCEGGFDAVIGSIESSDGDQYTVTPENVDGCLKIELTDSDSFSLKDVKLTGYVGTEVEDACTETLPDTVEDGCYYYCVVTFPDSSTASSPLIRTPVAQTLSFDAAEVDRLTTDEPFTNTLTGAQTTVTYSSSDEAVAAVDENGQVTIAGAGTTTITASAEATDDYKAASADYTLTVDYPVIHHEAVDVVYGMDGNVEYWEKNGVCYSNKACTKEITDVVVHYLADDCFTWTWTEGTDGKITADYTAVCANCGEPVLTGDNHVAAETVLFLDDASYTMYYAAVTVDGVAYISDYETVQKHFSVTLNGEKTGSYTYGQVVTLTGPDADTTYDWTVNGSQSTTNSSTCKLQVWEDTVITTTIAAVAVQNAKNAIKDEVAGASSDNVTAAVNAAYADIDNATTAAELETAKNEGIAAVRAAKLADEKISAKAAIDKAVGSDTSENVAAAANAAKAAIDAAADIAAVETAKTDGITAIQAAKDANKLAEAKAEAKAGLDYTASSWPTARVLAAAEAAKAAVDAAVTLNDVYAAEIAGATSIGEAQRLEGCRENAKDEIDFEAEDDTSENVTAAAAAAKAAIEAAETEDEINDEKDKGIAAVQAAKAANELAAAKTAAKADIDTEVGEDTSKNVTREAAAAKTAIDAAADTAAVETAKNDGIEAIQATKAANELAVDRKEAYADIDDAVDGDTAENVTAAAAAAKTAIDAAADSTAVETAKDDGIEAIMAAKRANRLAADKVEAKAAIDEAVGGDTSENVLKAADDAKAAIDAVTVEEAYKIEDAVFNGVEAINEAKAANQLAAAKEEAKAAIDEAVGGDTAENVLAAAEAAKEAVDAADEPQLVWVAASEGIDYITDARYANAEKAKPAANDAIDDAVGDDTAENVLAAAEAAKAAIEEAVTVAAVDAAKADGIAAIQAAKDENALAAAKAAAKTAAKAAIDDAVGDDTAENVAAAAEAAKAAIDAADTLEDIDAAKADGIAAVETAQHANMKNGWLKEDGSWYYYKDAVAQTGWLTDPDTGKTYYLDPDTGVMLKGWQQVDGKWYYLNSSLQTGIQKINGKWYNLNADAETPVTTWTTEKGRFTYTATAGEMLTGWIIEDGKWYYFSSNGARASGWLKDGDKWYYMNPAEDSSNEMLSGWQLVDGKWYYLNNSMKTGWQKISGKWYYFNNSMQTGWQQVNGKWYYLNTSMQTGWQQISGKWYYFGTNGAMVSSCTMTIDGKSYTFDAHGVWTR